MVVCVWVKWSEIGKSNFLCRRSADGLHLSQSPLQSGRLRSDSAYAGAAHDFLRCLQDICLRAVRYARLQWLVSQLQERQEGRRHYSAVCGKAINARGKSIFSAPDSSPLLIITIIALQLMGMNILPKLVLEVSRSHASQGTRWLTLCYVQDAV